VPSDIHVWWTNLEKPDPDASRALLKLADRPKETVAFLKQNLKPLSLDEKKLNELVEQLGSKEEKVSTAQSFVISQQPKYRQTSAKKMQSKRREKRTRHHRRNSLAKLGRCCRHVR